MDDIEHEADGEAGSSMPAVLPAAATTIATNPTQSKIEAVSLLLSKAIEKASELRLTTDESKALKADFPDEAFRKGAAGKDNLIYIEHAHLRSRLDDVLGMGQAVLVPRSQWREEFTYFKDRQEKTGVKVYVQAMLVVRGCYITEAVGEMTYYPGNQGADYSDAVEGAETAAFRRCCKKFGVGLQAWSKTWCEGWWRRKCTQTPTNGYQQGEDRGYEDHGSPMEACPKCGKTDSVTQGKAEYGGGLVCFKKKNGGCGHKWGGVDTNTGEAAAPVVQYPPIMEAWQAKLDDVTTLEQINGRFKTDFAAIPGKHPERAKIWAMTLKFATAMGWVHSHGEKKFVAASGTNTQGPANGGIQPHHAEVLRQFNRIGTSENTRVTMMSRYGAYKIEELAEGPAKMLIQELVKIASKESK